MTLSLSSLSTMLVAAVYVGFPPSVTTQQETFRSWPFGSNDLDTLPDADGDMLPEILAGAANFSAPRLPGAGRVFVLRSSSADLEPEFELIGTVAGQNLGESVEAIGDVDGDSYADFVASGYTGPMFVCNGMKGTVLFTNPVPVQGINDLGDVNGDNLADFVVGSPGAGRAFIFMGGTFDVRLEVFRPPQAFRFGMSVVVVGDVDGDAFPDFAVGAPGSGSPHDTNPGYVFGYSGSTGQLIYQIEGEGAGSSFGRDIASPGDLNGDGTKDLAVGSYNCCSTFDPKDGGPGRIYFFDGMSGNLIRAINPELLSSGFGLDISAAGDLNGNGFFDVLTYLDPPFPGSPVIRALDGATHETLFDLPSASAFSGGHNWNDDGFPDIVYGTGAVSVVSGAPPGVRAVGDPCATARAVVPRIGATGVPRIGVRYPIHLSDVGPGLDAHLIVGNLERVARRGGPRRCSLLVDPLVAFRTRTSEIGPGRGVATVELPVPSDPALVGASFLAQWLILDSGGRPSALTRALRITLAGIQ